ncbi:MAG TPA: right-handed parallel beta-helix repeat-containing protein [Candidatus Thermoplasmatota archaeon]|nr:right-handed parallel beta-helix repeat-containing protein [Candidatus Thermoplasmatota archaeon]
MKKIKIYKAVIAIAITMAFVMPVSAFANGETNKITSNGNNNIAINSNNRIGTISSDTPREDTIVAEKTDSTTNLRTRGTIYVDNDQSPGWYDQTHVKTIHEGVTNATAGDTVYVYNGIYYDHVIVNKKLSLIGESRDGVLVDGSGTGNVFYITTPTTQVNISNFSITNGQYGIYNFKSSFNNISNCNVYRCTSHGIYIYTTSNRNSVMNCNLYNNTGNGISITTSSNNNKIMNCNVYNNNLGILFSRSPMTAIPVANNSITNCNVYQNRATGISLASTINATLSGNTIYNNLYNFGVSATGTTYIGLGMFDHHIDPSNTIDGKPIYYLNKVKNTTIDQTYNAGFIGLVSCYNVTVKNINLRAAGVIVANTTHSTLSNITSSYSGGNGIFFYSASNNTITQCTLYNNSNGIFFIQASNNNLISNCRVYNTTTYGIGFNWLGSGPGCSYNIITNCVLYKNMYGLRLAGTIHNNSVTNCHAYNNSIGFVPGPYSIIANCEADHNGIGITGSSYGTIINCTSHDNTQEGIDDTALYSGQNVSIINCTVYNNPIGIGKYSAPTGIITHCTIYNATYGIYMQNSADNNNINNCIIHNTSYGIYIRNCVYNHINYNNLLGNGYGVWIQESSSFNIIDHNNFVNTVANGYDSTTDIWDNGSGGNYWSDYTGIDADLNGIGDTPYNISGGSNQDRYPLMLPLDLTPPMITNVQATPVAQRPNEYVNITCTVTDNWNMLDTVKLNVSGPGGFTLEIPMNNGGTYFYNQTYASLGVYNYFIQADDVQGNVGTSDIYSFVITDLDKPTSAVNPLPVWKTATPFAITATAYDNTAVSNVTLWYRYSSDGTSWTTWTSYGTDIAAPWSWSFTGIDGHYQFYSVAVDNYGNIEDAPSTADTSTGIDTTKPVTTATLTPLTPDGQQEWYVSTVLVTLTATDALSGVQTTWYRIDAGGWTLYSVPFSTSDGIHVVEYYSYDLAGNIEITNSVSFKVDTVAPSTTLALQGLIGQQGWYVTNVTVTLTAYDATSGVNYTKYKLNDGSWTVYSGPFTLTTNGNYTLSYYSVDFAGKTETTQQTSVQIQHDVLPPVTTPEFNGVMGNNNWFTSPVTVTFNAVDDSAGVASTKYQLDAGAWITYTGAFTVTDDAEHTILYYSIDNVGNTETAKGAILKIDQTVPTINITVEKTGLIRWLSTANVNDDTSGIARVDFYLDGVILGNVTEAPYEWEYTSQGLAQAIVYDNAGNNAISDAIPVSVDLNLNSKTTTNDQVVVGSQSQSIGSTSTSFQSLFRLSRL